MTQLSDTKFNLDKDYPFTNDIQKVDYIPIAASMSSASNLNQVGNLIFENSTSIIPIDICNALIYYQIKIEGLKTDAAKAEEDITLENNWFPRLFSQVSLQLGTGVVETIQDPGEVSSMLNFVLTDDVYKKEHGSLSGWIPDVATGDNTDKNPSYAARKDLYNKGFEGKFPLRNLFGYLQCYGRIILNTSLKLTLTRSINDADIFYGAASTAAEIKFEKLELWIPQMVLNLRLSDQLMRQVNENKNREVSYLYRQCTVISDLTMGTSPSFRIASLSQKPRYLFVGFKDPKSSFQTNNSLFIQKSGDKQITSLRVQLRNAYYPNNPMTFDSKKNHQMHPYENYIEMCKHFGNRPQLNYKDFKDLYSIFCFDLSAQEEWFPGSTCEVTLHITKDADFKAKCYCLILKEEDSTINVANGAIHLGKPRPN